MSGAPQPNGRDVDWVPLTDAIKARETAAHKADEGVLPLTEDSAALQFVSVYRDRLLYCHSRRAWFEWDECVWRQVHTKRAFHFAREIARTLSAHESDKIRSLVRSTKFAAGVERFAQSDPAFAVTAERWDHDPLLLGTPRGTVDLQTGQLRPADPADMITKSTAAGPAAEPNCPVWLNFLKEATGDNSKMTCFLQNWCGYCLTGLTQEHALVFIFGPGGNGKTVFLNVLTGILGTYATTAAMDTFTVTGGSQHPTDLAMLHGARLVTASETEESRTWAESRMKQITGGDPITARFMRRDFFTYIPQFKLTMAGNHKPILRNVGHAARRRFNMVPFTFTPTEPDKQLEEKLKPEWPAILRWMIEGCLHWQQSGLERPQCVTEATDAYFAEQDIVGQWLSEECAVDPTNTVYGSRRRTFFKPGQRSPAAWGKSRANREHSASYWTPED
jgi:putative DNA primase/helicase